MKIEYIKGDLFKTKHKVIVHGCNAQGRMGAGVARVVFNYYNEAFHEYHQEFKRNGLTLGTVIWAESNGFIFGNAITQGSFGSDSKLYVDYEAIRKCMEIVNTYCVEHGYTHVAMPKIGAGLGGGDWNIIENIIEDALVDVQPVVYTID